MTGWIGVFIENPSHPCSDQGCRNLATVASHNGPIDGGDCYCVCDFHFQEDDK